jgi:hypothetical protein
MLSPEAWIDIHIISTISILCFSLGTVIVLEFLEPDLALKGWLYFVIAALIIVSTTVFLLRIPSTETIILSIITFFIGIMLIVTGIKAIKK